MLETGSLPKTSPKTQPIENPLFPVDTSTELAENAFIYI